MIAIILLSIIIAYLLLTWIVVMLATRFPKTRKIKWINGAVAFIVMLMIPTGDMILGSMYFGNLCDKDSGLKIYDSKIRVKGFLYLGAPSTIAKYILENEGYDFIETTDIKGTYIRYSLDESGDLVEKHINSPMSQYARYENRHIPVGMGIYKNEFSIEDIKSGEILAEFREYFYGGGWVLNLLGQSFQGGGMICPHKKEKEDLLYPLVLEPAQKITGGANL